MNLTDEALIAVINDLEDLEGEEIDPQAPIRLQNKAKQYREIISFIQSNFRAYNGFHSSRRKNTLAIDAKNYRAASYQGSDAFECLQCELSSFTLSREGRSAGYVGVIQFKGYSIDFDDFTDLYCWVEMLSQIEDLQGFYDGLKTIRDRVEEFKSVTSPSFPKGEYLEIRSNDENGDLELILLPQARIDYSMENLPTLADLLEDIIANSELEFGTADQFNHLSESPCIYPALSEDQEEPDQLWYFSDHQVVNEIRWLWKYGSLTFTKLY